MTTGLGVQVMVALALAGNTVTPDTSAPKEAAVMASLLAVDAPGNAHKVTAYFPFGVSHALTLDARRQRWRGRAVLAASVPEGTYPVAVVVETLDGQRHVRRELVDVRRGVQPFEVHVREVLVQAGNPVELMVDSVEPVREVTASCASLGWNKVPLGLPTSGSKVDWGTLTTVPATTTPGNHQVTVTLTDESGRQLATTVTVTVTPGASS